MIKTLETKLDELFSLEPIGKNEAKIRDLISEISFITHEPLPGAKNGEIMSRCLMTLRNLENNKCLAAKKCEYSLLDVSRLLENVSLCCDILLADVGINLKFESESAEFSCCPQLIIDAFLNLISNSAKFGSGNEIDVCVSPCKNGFTVVVSNEGTLNFFDAMSGHGIKTAANAVKLHRGRLFYSSCNHKVKAGFSIPKGLDATIKFDVPPFSHYLEDSFSPVRIGLAELLK